VNPASVQGPGRTEGTARLLMELVRGRLPAVVDTTISLVDVADCAQGHLLAEAHGVPGERYLLSGATCSTREAVRLVRLLWGRPERVRWIPPGLVRVGGVGAEGLGRLLRRDLPLCREAVRTLLQGHRYDGSRAERDLGLRYSPLPETVRRTLTWYAERGLVPGPVERGGDLPP
jgi:dihydroflavonol-4-reductase